MKDRKGFTLIELLAVIIILGVLMIIAVPSVTKYINDSRKNGYVSTAKEIAGGVRNLLHSNSLNLNDKDTTYYIDSECIETSNSTESPYGEFTKAYVVVNYNDDGYDYYWVSVDETGNGVKTITNLESLDIDSIESNLTSNDIPDTLGVDARHNYVIINKESGCTIGDPTPATSRVTDDGSADVIDYPAGKSKRTLSYGDIVTIGDQEFHFLKFEGDDMYLLARYNLKVGKKVKFTLVTDWYDCTVLKTYSASDPGYGLQSSSCLGPDDDEIANDIGDCILPFSNSNYWKGKLGEGKKYADNYVYDENCLLYPYVENYKNYLESFGVNIKEARIPRATDLNFNSKYDNVTFGTTYWADLVHLQTPSTDILIFMQRIHIFMATNYSNPWAAGVRPVIII